MSVKDLGCVSKPNITHQGEFQIDNRTSKLIANLYSDKLTALLREYVANAMDATEAAGGDVGSIQVTLPDITDTQPTLRIKDSGEGIAPERIAQTHATYGGSSKEGQRGYFGFGAKAALEYTDNFRVITYKGGYAYTYYISKATEGPVCRLVAKKHKKGSGLEVIIPIQHIHVNLLLERAAYFFTFCPIPVRLCTKDIFTGTLAGIQVTNLEETVIVNKGIPYRLGIPIPPQYSNLVFNVCLPFQYGPDKEIIPNNSTNRTIILQLLEEAEERIQHYINALPLVTYLTTYRKYSTHWNGLQSDRFYLTPHTTIQRIHTGGIPDRVRDGTLYTSYHADTLSPYQDKLGVKIEGGTNLTILINGKWGTVKKNPEHTYVEYAEGVPVEDLPINTYLTKSQFPGLVSSTDYLKNRYFDRVKHFANLAPLLQKHTYEYNCIAKEYSLPLFPELPSNLHLPYISAKGPDFIAQSQLPYLLTLLHYPYNAYAKRRLSTLLKNTHAKSSHT